MHALYTFILFSQGTGLLFFFSPLLVFVFVFGET